MPAYWDEEKQKWIDKNPPGSKGQDMTPLGCLVMVILGVIVLQGITTGNNFYWVLLGLTIVLVVMIGNYKNNPKILKIAIGITIALIIAVLLLIGFKYGQ